METINKIKVIGIRLQENTYNELNDISKKEGIRISELVRNIIKEKIAQVRAIEEAQ